LEPSTGSKHVVCEIFDLCSVGQFGRQAAMR
jgi:hypothetical protein